MVRHTIERHSHQILLRIFLCIRNAHCFRGFRFLPTAGIMCAKCRPQSFLGTTVLLDLTMRVQEISIVDNLKGSANRHQSFIIQGIPSQLSDKQFSCHGFYFDYQENSKQIMIMTLFPLCHGICQLTSCPFYPR